MYAVLFAALVVGQYGGLMPQGVVIDANGVSHAAIMSSGLPGRTAQLHANPMALPGSALDYRANPPMIVGGMTSVFPPGVIGPVMRTEVKTGNALAKTPQARKAVNVANRRAAAKSTKTGSAAGAALTPKAALVHKAQQAKAIFGGP